MQILYGPDFNINVPTAVTIGKFDGLHSGHLRVIGRLLEISRKMGVSSIVYTFNLNPRLVLNNDSFIPLMSNKEKSDKIASLGVDYLVYEDFNIEFADMLPEEFVKKILVEKLNAKVVIMGENSTFGKDRAGDVELMIELGKKYGFYVEVIKLLKKDGQVISSTKIRENVKT